MDKAGLRDKIVEVGVEKTLSLLTILISIISAIIVVLFII